MTETFAGLGDFLFIAGFWVVAAIALACGILGVFVIGSAIIERRKEQRRAE